MNKGSVSLQGTSEKVLSAYRASEASSRPAEALVQDPRIVAPKLLAALESTTQGGAVELRVFLGTTEKMDIGQGSCPSLEERSLYAMERSATPVIVH